MHLPHSGVHVRHCPLWDSRINADEIKIQMIIKYTENNQVFREKMRERERDGRRDMQECGSLLFIWLIQPCFCSIRKRDSLFIYTVVIANRIQCRSIYARSVYNYINIYTPHIYVYACMDPCISTRLYARTEVARGCKTISSKFCQLDAKPHQSSPVYDAFLFGINCFFFDVTLQFCFLPV